MAELKKANLKVDADELEQLPVGDNDVEVVIAEPENRFWTSWRFSMSVMICLCSTLMYCNRVNLSMGIICMVEQTQGNTTTFRNCTGEFNITNTTVEMENLPGPKYAWSRGDQAKVLFAFYYGYFMTQILSGWLASRFGSRWVILGSSAAVAVCTLLSPAAASINFYMFYAIRVAVGAASGMVFPAAQAFVGAWAPPTERFTMSTLAFSGTQLGTLLTLPSSGFMCANGIGWPMIFYVYGICLVVWCVGWFFTGYSYPHTHPRLSLAEKTYIRKSRGDDEKKDEDVVSAPVPWVKLLTSRIVWVIVVANFCSDWGLYLFLGLLPVYLKEILYFDIQSNGVISALPYVAFWLAILGSGRLADIIIAKGWLSKVNTRRVINSAGFFTPAILMFGLAFMSCDNSKMAVVMLIICVGATGLQFGAWVITPIEVAPAYAGIIFGLSNSIASVSGVAIGEIARVIREREGYSPAENWKLLLILSTGVVALGGLVFLIFATSEEQEWAKQDKTEKPSPARKAEDETELVDDEKKQLDK